jgi:uncharacterized protein YjgD (DUF1641 family)
MSLEIAESDWKVFRKLHAVALERFFERAVSEIERLVSDQGKTSRERYWDAVEFIKSNRKELARLFDDMRRSTALIQLASIYSQKLLTAEEMSQFSPKAREMVQAYLGIASRSA